MKNFSPGIKGAGIVCMYVKLVFFLLNSSYYFGFRPEPLFVFCDAFTHGDVTSLFWCANDDDDEGKAVVTGVKKTFRIIVVCHETFGCRFPLHVDALLFYTVKRFFCIVTFHKCF